MSYLINSIFYTLQGEGYWTGRPAVFVRFSRCNLWTGREEDRANAICRFCDTDFTHADKMPLGGVIEKVAEAWGPWQDGLPYRGNPMVVLTGGEPGLQVDEALIDALHELGCYVAIETNGTQFLPQDIDWVCVSPKAGAPLATIEGDELKVVWPQQGLSLDDLYALDFLHYWLSPMDGPDIVANTATTVDYVLGDPRWRLNVQTHKVVGIA